MWIFLVFVREGPVGGAGGMMSHHSMQLLSRSGESRTSAWLAGTDGKYTEIQTNIATYKLNRLRLRLSENNSCHILHVTCTKTFIVCLWIFPHAMDQYIKFLSSVGLLWIFYGTLILCNEPAMTSFQHDWFKYILIDCRRFLLLWILHLISISPLIWIQSNTNKKN